MPSELLDKIGPKKTTCRIGPDPSGGPVFRVISPTGSIRLSALEVHFDDFTEALVYFMSALKALLCRLVCIWSWNLGVILAPPSYWLSEIWVGHSRATPSGHGAV